MSVDVKEIADSLTKAQREALLRSRQEPLLGRMKCLGKPKSLRKIGLAAQAWRGGDLLTPLGLAVRNHLLATEPTA